MEQQEKILQGAYLLRDISKLLMEMRLFEELSSKGESATFGAASYGKYVADYSRWRMDLEQMIERAEWFGIDPNDLTAFEKSLDDSLDTLLETGHLGMMLPVKSIKERVAMIMDILKNPKTLAGELMNLYPLLDERFDSWRPEIEKIILDLVRKYGVYKEDSVEREFLFGTDNDSAWFRECQEDYLFKKGMTEEEHQHNIAEFVDATIRGRTAIANNFSRYIAKYAELGIVMDGGTFTRLIEAVGPRTEYYDVLKAIKENPSIKPFAISDYLDGLFDDLVNHKDDMPHYSGSHFARKEIIGDVWYDFYLINALFGLIDPLLILYEGSGEELMRTLAQKIALMPDGDRIADAISDYLEQKRLYEMKEIFTVAYLEDAEALPKVRTDFVMTLRAVADKQTMEVSHE